MRTISTNLFGLAAVFSVALSQYVSPISPQPAGPDAITVSPQEPAEPSKRAEQRVTGRVVDRDGTAVSKAEVRFEGPKRERVWSNAAGEFSFAGPAGDYVITVKAGDRKQDFRVKIADNQLEPSTLIIEPKTVERQ
jgi:hypothetical protein